MRVHHQPLGELGNVRAGLAPDPARNEPKTSFAETLAKSEGAQKHSSKKAHGDALPKGPKGETTRAVEGHPAYVEIMSGPRNGMFINVTHNERRGEAFTLVRRHDRDLHIYGTGKDRRVVISWHKDQPAHSDGSKAAKQSKPATGGTSPA
jgi:hypothetical protein